MTERGALRIPNAARYLDISRAHCWRLVRSGRLPSVQLGAVTVVPVVALDRMLADAVASNQGSEA